MRRFTALGSILVASALAAGCSDQTVAPTDLGVDQALIRAAPDDRNLAAELQGSQEVPAVQTDARGVATFHLNKAGTELHYRVHVANIDNVLMAHIHVAPPGVNGPIVVWLYPPAPPPSLIPGESRGLLARGTITDANLVGPLADMTLADLLAEMRAGNTYVNVHTQQNPGGEIRGQIFVAGAPHQNGSQ